MGISAIDSSLQGIASAQARMDAASSVTASDGLVDDTGSAVGAVLDMKDAQVQQSVSIEMLRKSMQAQESLINVFA
ncbi:MAG: hypothetical protein AAGC46_00915 [Solirubrobacteraceae bacterium]|nr:hypothetical protein [Patulibacter sp.]